jgi:hypothetical protein
VSECVHTAGRWGGERDSYEAGSARRARRGGGGGREGKHGKQGKQAPSR